ncbi:MAG TPA: hypothetical protein VGC91_11795 [Pyrinomonadaceae bacterium]|jgi:hypothetical protein
MKNLKRVLLAATMTAIVSFGALAQDQKKGEKPPPKETTPKVVNQPKDNPPKNSGQSDQKKGDDKKGKP